MQNSEKVQRCVDALLRALDGSAAPLASPRIGLILGTGLGETASWLETIREVPFAELPGFPVAGVDSHAGRFLVGRLDAIPLIVQQGRCHLYEGHSADDVCLGTRVMAGLGATTLIVTNAAGALHPLFNAGDIMCVSDQINATGRSPLIGPGHDASLPRFPDMSRAYDPELRRLALEEAAACGLRLEQGVYAGVLGPQLETPAETRALRMLGADAVGMSTVLEVIAARQLGLRILGFSILTNKNLPDAMQETSLQEIVRVATLAGTRLACLLPRLIRRMAGG